jgi:hypothetical protein
MIVEITGMMLRPSAVTVTITVTVTVTVKVPELELGTVTGRLASPG